MDEKSDSPRYEQDFWWPYDRRLVKKDQLKLFVCEDKPKISNDTKIHRCLIHNEAEVSIPGAPQCFNCWHQFLSYEDLLEQDLGLRKKLQLMTMPPNSGQEVDCCPLCARDL